MDFSQLYTRAVCLVLVITSAGNFKVNAAAQQYEAKTLEQYCPCFGDDFSIVRNKLLQDIGHLLEQFPETVTQSPTTEIETTEQSTESPTTGQTTEESIPTTKAPLYTCNGTPGWRRAVFINMTDTSYDCPPGLNLTSYSKRTCGRAHTNVRDCSSTTFSVGGSEYSQVCGRIIGYQVGATYGFLIGQRPINTSYVAGISLTHGPASSRQHIWTFGAGVTESPSEFDFYKCPCDFTSSSHFNIGAPEFLGNDYFCESGFQQLTNHENLYGMLLADDPLWDGKNCTPTSRCCQFNNPPWFTKTLPNSTTDDIELRLCLFSAVDSETVVDDTPVELIELYTK